MSDEVLGKQFRAFIEGIFSYTPQVTSRTTASRSQYNGSVIQNIFSSIEDEIKSEYTKSLNNIKKAQARALRQQEVELQNLQNQLSNSTIQLNPQEEFKVRQRAATLEKEINEQKIKFDKEYEQQKINLETERDKKLRENSKKADEADFEYKKNLWIKADVVEKARILERRQEELRSAIEVYEKKQELGAKISTEEAEQYKKSVEEKKDIDARYLAVQMGAARFESRSTRYQRYTNEVERLRQEQRSQELINRKVNANDPDARRARSREISQQTRESIRTAQQIYGFTAGRSGVNRAAEVTENVASVIATGPSGIVNTIENMLGKTSPVVSALMAVLKIVGSINQVVGQGIQKAVGAQTQYMGQMNARLQKSSYDTTNYYEQMIDWSNNASDEFGLAIGEWNSFVNKTNYVEKLNELVQSGVAYNAEERALIATLSDRMVTTFDALDQSLTRLIRIQQRDMTYAALGSEALLTEFLNSQFKDTSYLNNMYDSVAGILLDATAKMSADQASAFQFEVQKWLGSLYSVGLSESGVQSLAQGITYLATGDVSSLTSNQQLQYIYGAAAERGGMSLADILISGLDYETTNELLKNVVSLLSDIYVNAGPNTVQAAWAGITGLSISDLRSIQNINNQISSISQSHATWVDSLRETENQLSLIEENSRTSSAMKIENLINNALFSLGENVLEDTFGSGPLGIWRSLGIEGESKYLGYYLGSKLGGTIGNLLTGFSTMPALIDTLSKQFSTLQNNAILVNTESGFVIDPETGRTQKGKIDKFKLLSAFNASPLTSILSNVASDITSDFAIQNSRTITNSTYSEFVNAVESLTPVVNSGIPTLIEQAELASQTAATVVNESSEDRALLEEATNVQDYLFENDQTIRVTLSLIEDKALADLFDALKVDIRSKDLADIKSTVQNKVNVDIVDNDINILLNSMDRMKWSM